MLYDCKCKGKPEYMGHTVNFRSSKKSYRDKRVKNDPSDWLIFENTHEAIVDPETWQLAQQVKRTVRRTDTTGVANPLTGLVFCADCRSKTVSYTHLDVYKRQAWYRIIRLSSLQLSGQNFSIL